MKLRIKNPLSKGKVAFEAYNPFIHGVRQSNLQNWLTCREMARLNVLQGWSSIFSGMPLVYGSLSHGVLKQVYRNLRDAKANRKLTKTDLCHDSVIAVLIKESEDEVMKEHPNPPSSLLETKEEACAILAGTLPSYFNKWWEEDNAVKWDMVEDKFAVPLTMRDGAIIPLTGTFDATFKKRGGTWLFETKNKARWSQKIGSLLPLDLQLGIYLTVMEMKYKVRPTGVRYNLMRRPGERRGKNESLMDYAARIAGNCAKDPDHYFERIEMELLQSEHDEHVRRTTYLVQEFYDWWKLVDHTARDLMWNSGSCETKYGECHYLDLCANNDTSMYRHRPRDKVDSLL